MTDELNRPLSSSFVPTPRPSSVHLRAAPQPTRPAPSAASAARKRLSLRRVRWGTTSGMPAGQRIAALFIPCLLNIIITRPHQTCIVNHKQKSLNCWGDFAACPKMHAKRNSEVDCTNPEIILLMPFSFIRFAKAMPPRKFSSLTVPCPCPCLVFGICGCGRAWARSNSARSIYRFFVPVTLY